MKDILAKIQYLEPNLCIPDSFNESSILSKEEIIDEDIVTSEDLSRYSDELLTYCSSFNQNGTDMLLSIIIDKCRALVFYVITEGESTMDKLVKKGFLKLF